VNTLIRVKPDKQPRGISAKHYRLSSDIPNSGFIAVISFHGKVPDGSKGKRHAEFITLECLEWMRRLNAICLIIDFRDLNYQWGDSLVRVFDSLRKHYHYEWHDLDMNVPIKLLASQKSCGLFSLINNPSLFFETTDAAIESCQAHLERWMTD